MAGLAELTADSWDDPDGPGRASVSFEAELAGDLIARLRAEDDGHDPAAAGITALRDLLRVETREARIRRIMRVWEAKVIAAIERRDLHTAESWVKAVTEKPTFSEDFEPQVRGAIQALARPAVIDDLLTWLVGESMIEEGAPVLSAWGEPIVARVLELMAMDEPPILRRFQVDLLAAIGRTDTRLLIAHVSDKRWFIVRNIAIAIGRTGRLQGVGPLRSLLTHPDSRVRVEALRGLAALDAEVALPDLIAGFRDPDPRVRQAAVTLLRASPSPQVIPILADLVAGGSLGPAESERLIEVIAERKDPAADAALRRFIGKRFPRGGLRAARDAARKALERRGR